MAELDQRQFPARLINEWPDGQFHIDGVRWGFEQTGEYVDWRPIVRDAFVDTRRVKDVYLAIEPFAPEWLAAHAFLAFEVDVRSSSGETDGGLAISVEARMHRGEEFDLVRGMMRAYGIVFQVGTWTDAVQKACRAQGHKLIRHRLLLDPEQKRRLLANILRKATDDHSRDFYNTVTNSCLTSAIRGIDSALPYRHRVSLWLAPGVPNIAAALPRTADVVLTARHALDGAPCILTQPDRALFPASQAVNNGLTLAAARLSVQPAWRPALRIGGLLAGFALGTVTGARPWKRVGLALAGQVVGRVAADLIKSRALTRFEPCEPYLDGTSRMSGS